MSEPAGAGGGEEPPRLARLDPDRAAAPPGADDPRPAPVIDTRRYGWILGIVGLAVIVGIAVYQFATHGVTGTGVPPGQRLHLFAAPLADTNLNGDPNPHPTCTPARHDPRALNLCLLAGRGPIVLSLFVTGASSCERQVDALQTLAARFPTVQFAAVAVNAGHAATAAAVRRNHWTIPVAYDADGTVQQLYGVVACPMVEMAARGGIVRSRLVGDRWQSAAALTPYVRELVAGPPSS